MQFPQPFSDRLRTLREARGLSQVALERLAGLPRGSLCRLEQGTRPTDLTLAALAAALQLPAVGLTSGTDYSLRPLPFPAWARRVPDVPWRRPDWPLSRRLPTALESYPRICEPALRALTEHPHAPELAALFCDLWTDSNLEVPFWLRLSRQASPHWRSLLQQGFRLHSVVCPYTERAVGDLPHPCLVTESPVRAVWFPQVTLRTGGFLQRPDGLVGLEGGGWAALHINGGGHDSQFDRQKQLALGLPTVSLTTSDVLGDGLMETLRVALSAMRLAA